MPTANTTCPDRVSVVAEVAAHLHRSELLELKRLGVDVDDAADVQRAMDDEEIMATLASRLTRRESALYERFGPPWSWMSIFAVSAESYALQTSKQLSELEVGILVHLDAVGPDVAEALDRAHRDPSVMTVVRARMCRPNGLLERMKERLGAQGEGLQ